ncbi:MAG: thioredoxin family protein [Planctomycetota bacterium]|nr:thioredoxin family protein [Planctomycetota bacterium]
MLSLLTALTLSSTPLLAISPVEEPPAIFARATFEEARATANREGKLLVLDAMTSWCGPCKKMDVTTWVDPDLVAWMGANTVAVQLDMDLHTELKDELAIAAFPTIVAFDANGEADRIVGYRDAKAMGDWLALVRSGSTELERLLSELEARTWTNSLEDLRSRQHYANELFYLAGYSDARRLLFEIWEAAPAAGFDRSNLRSPLGSLARVDVESAQAIEALRLEVLTAGAPLALSADSAALSDWIDLSVALGDSAGLEAWALGRNARGEGDVVRRFGSTLYPLLLLDKKWRAAGIALVDPIGRFERSGAALAGFDDFGKGGAMTMATPILSAPVVREAAAPKAEAKSSGADPVVAKAPVQAAPDDDAGAATKKGTSFMAMPMIGAGAKASSDSDETGVLIRAQYRWDASHAYAALLAADRTDEATALGELVLRYEDSPKARIALVSRALEAGQGDSRRAVHFRWLDAATSAPSSKLE